MALEAKGRPRRGLPLEWARLLGGDGGQQPMGRSQRAPGAERRWASGEECSAGAGRDKAVELGSSGGRSRSRKHLFKMFGDAGGVEVVRQSSTEPEGVLEAM